MTNTELIDRSKQKFTEDEFIGELLFDPIMEQWNFIYRSDYNLKFAFPSDCENEVVCVILESPHINEFIGVDLESTDEKRINSRPLNNPKSRKGLSRMLNSSSFYREYTSRLASNKKFDVVLVNAIQYQCSLGDSDTSKFRDDAFILNWIESQNSFVKRIKTINPALIINCCTKGTWRDDKYIDNSRLEELGLEFNNVSPVFQTKLSENRKDFTLKDLVECKLVHEGLISDSAYFRYDHPSSLVSKDPRDIRFSDKVVVSKSELVGVSRKTKQRDERKIQSDGFVQVILDYDKVEEGRDFFIGKPGSSYVLTTGVWADHILKEAISSECEPVEDQLLEYYEENVRLFRWMEQTIERHNFRLKFKSAALNGDMEEYVMMEYPPAEYSPYGFDPEYDYDEFETSLIHPLIDTTRFLLKNLEEIIDDRIGKLSLRDIIESDLSVQYNGFNSVLAIDLEDEYENEMNCYVAYFIDRRELKFQINTSFLEGVIVKTTRVPEEIAISNSFGAYFHASIKRIVEELTGFEYKGVENYFQDREIEFM